MKPCQVISLLEHAQKTRSASEQKIFVAEQLSARAEVLVAESRELSKAVSVSRAYNKSREDKPKSLRALRKAA